VDTANHIVRSMFQLLGVPQNILSTVLGDWCGLHDLARLDSAVCNHDYRPQLLALIRFSTFILSTTTSVTGDEAKRLLLEWLTKRALKREYFMIRYDVECSLIMEFAESTGGEHVRTLNLSDMKEETAGTFSAVFSHCKNIANIDLDNLEHWTGLSVLKGDAADALRNLSVVRCGTKSTRYFDRNCFTNLQSLHLVGEYSATTVKSLLQACPNLTDLRLKDTHIEDTGLQTMPNRTLRLETLMLYVCSKITDAAVAFLSPRCSALRTLGVESCKHVTSAALEEFLAQCSQLECLKLSECRVDRLSTVVSNFSGSLVHLSLSRMQSFGDGALQAVAETCRNLQGLELSACEAITANGLVSTVSALSCLRELQIAYTGAVTDAVLTAIAKHLPELTYLSLYKSNGFTECGALKVVLSLRRLNWFVVHPNHAIFTRLVLDMWQHLQPGLEISDVDECSPAGNELYNWY
jgi:hypothetical protein